MLRAILMVSNNAHISLILLTEYGCVQSLDNIANGSHDDSAVIC